MDMPLSDKEEIKLCESCVLGKNHCHPYPTNAKASRSKKAREFFQFGHMWSNECKLIGRSKVLCSLH